MVKGKTQQSAKRRRRPPSRVSVGCPGAETYVEGITQSETMPHSMEGLYVDDVPVAKNGEEKKRKGKRAAERRRARGEAPKPLDGTDTKLQQRGAPKGGESGQFNYAAGVLTCVKGPEEGLALNLLEGSYTIGRGRDNNFVLKDIAASRKHVRVDVRNNQVTVEDLESGNGTRLNGKRIQRATLKNGDRLEIGNSILVFTFLGNDRSHPSIPPRGGALGDEAQQRLVEAAERLAAELSERLRPEDEFADSSAETANGRIGSSSKGRAASSHERIESGIDEVLTARANRSSSKSKSPVPMPDQLWNETDTKIPLSDVVPADDRLASEPSIGTLGPPPAAPSLRSERSPAPRPKPRVELPELSPIGPRMMSDRVPVPSRSGPSFEGLLLLSLLVVVGIGGGLFALYSFVLKDGQGSVVDGRLADEQGRVDDLLEQAQAAMVAGDFARAEALIGKAEEVLPDDKAIALARSALEAAQSQRKGDEAANGREGAEAFSAEPPKAAPPPREDVEQAPAPAGAKKVISTEEVKPKERPPPPKAKPNAKPNAKPKPKSKPKPRPKRKPRRPKPQAMTDAEAGALFREGVMKVRGDDERRGCALLQRVMREAPSTSNWKVKAANVYERYGCR